MENDRMNPPMAQQPPHYDYQIGGDQAPMSLKDWLITLLILAIPFVNIIMLLVWGLSEDVNVNKRNYCRATLILMLISMAIVFFIWIIFGVFISTIFMGV